MIVRERRSSVAIAAERLRGKKACAGRATDGGGLSAVQSGTERLRGIHQQLEFLARGNELDGGIIRGLTKKIDWHDGSGLKLALPLHHLHSGFEAFRVEVISVFENIDEHR